MLSNRDRNKPRLYVGHYLRLGGQVMPGGEDRFHWALLLAAKDERRQPRGYRFHARDSSPAGPGPGAAAAEWQFLEEETTRGGPDRLQLLTRTRIGKVRDVAALRAALQRVPVRGAAVPGWNCVAWVREALEGLGASAALGTAVLGPATVLDWAVVRDAAIGYTERKIAEHRFDGRGGRYPKNGTPTWDLLTGREVTR